MKLREPLTPETMILNWEEIENEKGLITQRLSVPGGWLVRTVYEQQFLNYQIEVDGSIIYQTDQGNGIMACGGTTFVPDPKKEWLHY